MPSSHSHQISNVVELIKVLEPTRVLDLGFGLGKYGLLTREYADLKDDGSPVTKWRIVVDGVEAHEPYVGTLQREIYNTIFIGNLVDVLPTLSEGYDLIFLIDVLEHLNYDDGIRALQECRRISRNTIISTPKDIGIQDDSFGNPFEEHRFQWKPAHFRSLFEHSFGIRDPRSYLFFCGEDSPAVRRKYERHRLQSFKRRYPWTRPLVNLGRILHMLYRR